MQASSKHQPLVAEVRASTIVTKLSGIYIIAIIESPHLLDKLRCLDVEYHGVKFWKHLAEVLKIPSEITQQIGRLQNESPTILLFEYLRVTHQDLNISKLKTALQRIYRADVYNLIQGYKDTEKVADVITPSDILFSIAIKLDDAVAPLGNWERLALELGIKRDKCSEIKMQLDPNAAKSLFKYLQAVNPSFTVEEFKMNLDAIGREDVLELLNVEGDTKLFDVLKPGSPLFMETMPLLNKLHLGEKGWLCLGHQLGIPQEILESMDVPSVSHIQSPIKKMLTWLASDRPHMTANDLTKALLLIQRTEAVQLITSHFGIPITEVSPKTPSEEGTEKPPELCAHPLQATDDGKLTVVRESPVTDDVMSHFDRTTLCGIQETTKVTTNQALEPTGERGKGFLEKPELFIGRKEQCQELVDLMRSRSRRMIAVFGLSGFGKTTLAAQASHDLIENHGIYMAYVNSRHVYSVDNLAEKILEAFRYENNYKNQDPLEQALNLMESFTREVILIIENVDKMLNAFIKQEKAAAEKRKISTVVGAGLEMLTPPIASASQSIRSACASVRRNKSGQAFTNFISDIIQRCPQVNLLVTSWERIDQFQNVNVKNMKLNPLTLEESVELLHLKNEKLSRENAVKIAEYCMGYPLYLCANSVQDFPECLDAASSREVGEMLNRDNGIKDRVQKCLQTSFNRMHEDCQELIVELSVIPENFTMSLASLVTGKKTAELQLKLQNCLNILTNKYCFIRYDKLLGTYTLHSVIRLFGIEQGKTSHYKRTFKSARKEFIKYCLKELKEYDTLFFGKKSKEAVVRYRQAKFNIRQIIQWCISESDEVGADLVSKAIDVLIDTSLFLVKVMSNVEFHSQFSKLAELCEKKKDYKSQCEIIMYRCVKVVINCNCYPKICPVALYIALDYCKRASDIRRNRKIDQDLRFERTLSQFKGAYGRCLARRGSYDYGEEKLEESVKRCKEVFKKSKQDRDKAMLALCYLHFAVSKSYICERVETIRDLHRDVLPLYHEVLCEHPFTGTAYHYLAMNYFELGNYPKADEYNRKALKYRGNVLGDHPDTARSWFEMGITYAAQAESLSSSEGKSNKSRRFYEKAVKFLMTALKMQQRVLDTPEETMITHQELIVVLTALGRHEEAKEHMDEIVKCIPKREELPIASEDDRTSS